MFSTSFSISWTGLADASVVFQSMRVESTGGRRANQLRFHDDRNATAACVHFMPRYDAFRYSGPIKSIICQK